MFGVSPLVSTKVNGALCVMKVSYKNIGFSLIAAIGIILAMEALLQGLSLAFPIVKATLAREPTLAEPTAAEPTVATHLADERLGHRPNPKYPGHDSKGWRNERVPAHSAIVALGDSQTYGINVSTFQAWPQQLGLLSGQTTYNMAYGGYGPPNYLLLFDEALELRPQLVIATFYTGNDLWEAFQLVHIKGKLPNLKSSLEDHGSLPISAEESLATERNLTQLTDQIMHNLEAEPKIELGRGKLREFLADNSKLYGILRLSRRAIESMVGLNFKDGESWNLIRRKALLHKEDLLVIENGTIRTVLSPKYRLSVLDLGSPIIRAGRRISLKSFELMNQRAKSEGILFAVLLIPTKELVFKDEVSQSTKSPPETYARLVQNEELVWNETRHFFETHGIMFVDSLEGLRECLRKGQNPYLETWDGHPNAIGYSAIATSVFSQLDKLPGWIHRKQ
jgi:hypothetical protein